MKDKVEEIDNESAETPKPTSLSQLTKRNKKTKDVNNMLKKIAYRLWSIRLVH